MTQQHGQLIKLPSARIACSRCLGRTWADDISATIAARAALLPRLRWEHRRQAHRIQGQRSRIQQRTKWPVRLKSRHEPSPLMIAAMRIGQLGDRVRVLDNELSSLHDPWAKAWNELPEVRVRHNMCGIERRDISNPHAWYMPDGRLWVTATHWDWLSPSPG